ncbi:MAG: class I SAM-dependent methyltransferase [Nanoarchaeota archaeon]|nr:class I SAM-dependent methyltransferase [Nanoarchaeota archaeon]
MDLEFVKRFYEEHLTRYGKEDIRGMGWHEEDEYSIRFDIVTQGLDLDNASILDVGCGYGGLYKHLVMSEVKNFSYLGIDFLPQMVKAAKEKNPTGRFEVCDILSDNAYPCDYVFCIGALNVKTEGSNEYFREMLAKMISLAKKAVIISFLSDKMYLANGPYHFENAEQLKTELEQNHQVKVEVRNDPRLRGESCLVIHRF